MASTQHILLGANMFIPENPHDDFHTGQSKYLTHRRKDTQESAVVDCPVPVHTLSGLSV